MKKTPTKNGSALIVSILVLVIIITITLSITLVSIQNETASQGEYVSSRSFQTADTGIEDLMYDLTKKGKSKVSDLDNCKSGGLIEDGNYMVTLLDKNKVPINCTQNISIADVVSIKSVSKVLSQSRAVEADVICRTPFTIDSDTLAFYTFQERDDAILDYSGHNNIAEVKGSVPVVTGICNARLFDGNSADYITVKDYNSPNAADNTLRIAGKNMTVEAWVKWDGHGGDWQRIVGKGDPNKRNYGLWMKPSEWLFQIYDGLGGMCNVSDTGAANAPDEKWHYLAGTYDGSNIKIYLDGKKIAESGCNITPATSADPLTIGYAGYHAPFSGIIDEVTVSKATKSGTDIQARFDQGKIFNLP